MVARILIRHPICIIGLLPNFASKQVRNNDAMTDKKLRITGITYVRDGKTFATF
jgi:hypothetical protein